MWSIKIQKPNRANSSISNFKILLPTIINEYACKRISDWIFSFAFNWDKTLQLGLSWYVRSLTKMCITWSYFRPPWQRQSQSHHDVKILRSIRIPKNTRKIQNSKLRLPPELIPKNLQNLLNTKRVCSSWGLLVWILLWNTYLLILWYLIRR